MIGQRFGPHGINFEARRLDGGGFGLPAENAGADAERNDRGEKCCPDIEVPFHVEILYQTRLNCMRLVFIVLAAALAAQAHDIPNDVTLQAFLKPEGQRLRLLVRAPMKAMRDVEFPQKGPGYLDLARSGPFLADAATLWISDAIALYEGETRLPKARV